MSEKSSMSAMSDVDFDGFLTNTNIKFHIIFEISQNVDNVDNTDI